MTTTTGTTGTGASDSTVGAGTDLLWQNLADALNDLIAVGLFPDLHNLYGPLNDRQYQPYVTDDAHSGAPWVVFDLSTRQFTVSSRERTYSGEHSASTRRKRH